MANPEAEEQKELGNAAFAKKEYESAITFYTEAIRLDETSHVYYSNRSACHAGLGKWEEAAEDAKKCVSVDPTFIKGYYRLTTAQIELKQLDEALKTVKLGLQQDVDNTQLLKQQRQIRAAKASQRQKEAAARRPTKESSGNGNNTLSSSNNREVMDLQQQYIATSRECQVVKASISKSQREQKVNSITLAELERLPSSSEASESIKMYRGVGKMFMLSDQEQVMEHLKKGMLEEKKREADLTSKMDYLERRIKSQQTNIQELVRAN